MKVLLTLLAFLLTQSLTVATNPAFVLLYPKKTSVVHKSTMNDKNEMPCASSPHPFTMLPGDPSLILTTNVDLGDKKLEIMKGEFL